MKILTTPLYSLSEQLQLFPQSAFGVVRKHDVHTGVDIYCEPKSQVFSATTGAIESIELFTGPQAGSPWWNETFAVVIRTPTCYLLYGELTPEPTLKKGAMVEEGALLGRIAQVLKSDKGKNPLNMLHVEMYQAAPFALTWNLNEHQPESLLDPTSFLLTL